MTYSLPDYDNWKLASPPEAPDCTNCGHEAGEHLQGTNYHAQWTQACTVRGCKCDGYSDEPPEDDPDRKADEARERRLFD